MRLATMLAATVVPLSFMVSAPAAMAQLGTGVYGFGLVHSALGQAGVDYDPVARRLPVNNIGSSGQDGVEIQLGRQATGHSLQFSDVGSLNDPGASHSFECRGTSGGLGAVVGRLTTVRNSDGSEDLSPDFSGLGATSCWVVLVDGSGAVVKRVHRALPFTLHVSSSAYLSKKGYDYYQAKSNYRWIQASYDHAVRVSSGGGGTDCDDVRFICDSGNPVEALNSIQLTCTIPSGAGSFVVSEEGIVPPCAGCPNGPDDNGVAIALGDAHWDLDGAAGGPVKVLNLGSSGLDGVSVKLRESPTLCCLKRSGMILDEQPLAPGTLTCDATGKIGGLDHPLGRLSCFVGTDKTEFEPDFSAVGSPGYRVLLYSNGTVVADVTNPVSRASHQKPQTTWLVQTDLIGGTGPAEFRIICITSPCPGWTVTLNGALYIVDQIAFQPVGAAVPAPTALTSLAFHTTGGSTLPIYGITGDPQLPVVGVDTPAAPVELAAARLSPNPGSGPMSLVFAMPRAGSANIAVIDAAGRQVRGLATGNFAAGAHELKWDGRDDAGNTTAPGIYFVRVSTDQFTRVARATRLW